MRLTLDDKTVTMNLPANHKTDNARLDRFRLVTISSGGSHVRVYLGDLKYTASKIKP